MNTEQAAAIEVWRGPASAVLGGNALHGAINVITPIPEQSLIALEAGPDEFGRVAWQGGTDLGGHKVGLLSLARIPAVTAMTVVMASKSCR